MTPNEFELELQRLGISLPMLARLSGKHLRTLRRYRAGATIPSTFADWLRSISAVSDRKELQISFRAP